MSYTRGYIREALIRYRFVTVELCSRCMLASRSLNGGVGMTFGDGHGRMQVQRESHFSKPRSHQGKTNEISRTKS
jgi:hypothetical protein